MTFPLFIASFPSFWIFMVCGTVFIGCSPLDINGTEIKIPELPPLVPGIPFLGGFDTVQFPATGSRPREIITDLSLKTMADSSALFAWNSYQALGIPYTENVFYSPYSIMNALGMLSLGAEGSTRVQLMLLMGLNPLNLLDPTSSSMHKGLQKENAKLRAEKTSRFAIANKFFVDSSSSSNINRDYLNKLSEFYASSMQAVNFTSNPAEAREVINDWVSENTYDKIQDFLPTNLDPRTQLILANAIYFDGKWDLPFSTTLTSSGEFQTSNPEIKVRVPFMYQNTKLYYAHDDYLGLETLIIPYTNSKYAMHLIVPDRSKTLEDIERGMNHLHLNVLDRSTRLSQVVLKMPKLSLKQRISLNDMLFRMNATNIFNPLKNDFSGIFLNSRPGFFVDDVIHEAVVEVNEEGTVASAATSIIGTRTAQPDLKIVVVDRPFLFYISDESNGFILFWGRVNNPTS